MKDSELIYNVERAMEHDKRAFETLYQYTYSRMYALVYGLCSNKNDVEDILQEGYTTAFLKIRTLDEKRAFYSWLRKIIINTWRNYSRKESKKHTNDVYETEIYNLEDNMMEPSPYDVVEDTIIREQILKLVDSLSESQRVCMILYYYDNMKMEEIADALDIPLGSVKSRLHYGRKRLGSAIKEQNLFSLNLLVPSAAADRMKPGIFMNILAALEEASKSSAAAAVAKTTGGGLALKLARSRLWEASRPWQSFPSSEYRKTAPLSICPIQRRPPRQRIRRPPPPRQQHSRLLRFNTRRSAAVLPLPNIPAASAV